MISPMWEQHGTVVVVLSVVVVSTGRWIVRHVKELTAKLNGFTVIVHKDEEPPKENLGGV